MEGSSVLPDSWSLSLFPDILPDPNSNLPDLDIWTSSLMFPVSATFPNNQKRPDVREEVRQVFSCGKCGQRFQHLKSLKRHEASTTTCSRKPTPTFWDSEQFCRTLTTGNSGWVQGEEKEAILDETCPVCRATFSSSDKLLIHSEEHFSRFVDIPFWGNQNVLNDKSKIPKTLNIFDCPGCVVASVRRGLAARTS